MSDLSVCRCCLATQSSLIQLDKEHEESFGLVISPGMQACGFSTKVCHTCFHSLKSMATFKQRCLKVERVLEEYLANQLNGKLIDTSYFKNERQKIILRAEPSLSNTLCIDVLTYDFEDSFESAVSVTSFVNDFKYLKNTAENMDIVLKSDIKEEGDECAFKYSDNDEIDAIADSFEVFMAGGENSAESLGELLDQSDLDCFKDIKKETSEDDSAGENIALCQLAQMVKNKTLGKRKRSLPLVYVKKKRDSPRQTEETNKLRMKLQKKNNVSIESTSRPTRGKLFPQPDMLKNRNCLSATEKIDNVCEVCDRSFSAPSKLKEHMLDHTGERPFACDECGKTFKKAHILRGHKRTHLPERPFPCDLCSSSFLFEKNLQKHRKLHTGDRPHECKTCGKSFVDKTYLKRHEMIHMNEITFTCDECGLSFAQLSKLKYHKLSHKEERPFSCEECGKAFKLIGQLNNHKSTHTGEKPFTCDVCGRSFRQAGNFNCHKRVHTGERPFTCNICGNSYTEAGYLKKHTRIHTGEKPFSCDVCGKSFVETCGLRRHKLVHTGEQRYSCNECGSLFKQPGGLRKHKRKHVAEKLSTLTKWRAQKNDEPIS